MQQQNMPAILIVEDDTVVAMFLEEVLERAGYIIIGPVATLGAASCAALEEEYDIALLDLNLLGHSSVELAAMLKQRGVPTGFCSGYGSSAALPEGIRDLPMLSKPANAEQLLEFVSKLADKVTK
jgi:CheY-like chemotaxis protein